LLKKEDGLLDFNLPAEFLLRMIRAFNPWPGAYMLWKNQPLKILRASIFQNVDSQIRPDLSGQRIVIQGKPAVSCLGGILVLEIIQQAGKKAMDAKEFLHGARNWVSSSQLEQNL